MAEAMVFCYYSDLLTSLNNALDNQKEHLNAIKEINFSKIIMQSFSLKQFIFFLLKITTGTKRILLQNELVMIKLEYIGESYSNTICGEMFISYSNRVNPFQ